MPAQFCRFTAAKRAVTTVTAAALIAATLTPVPNAAGRSVSHGPIHLPVVLMAAIDEAPTTLGIADSNLYTLSEADLNKTLDELQSLGVKDVRIAVPWIFVQPTSSQSYDWSRLDMVVNAVAERDMGVLGVISATPAWAGFPLNGHPNPATYAAFASAVATRYQGKISAYEVWNEPNGVTFWSPVSAKAYTDLLKAAYPAIKAADPNATVIGGVLGAVGNIPGVSTSAVKFVNQMYADGAHGFFDALSFHPYHYVTPFSKGTMPAEPIEQVAAIRALMAANGDADLKLWATEYGLPTSVVSQAQQAAYIHDFVVAWQQVTGAGPMFIYTTRDTATGAFDDEANFGIFTTNWTPKLAAQTVAALIADLADGTAEPFDVTPYMPANPFLQGVQVFIRQLINQALVVPKFIVQLVSSVVNAVVKTIAAGLGIPTAGRTAATRTSAPAALTAVAPNPRRAVATSKRQPATATATPSPAAASAPSAQRRGKPAQQRADRAASGGSTGHSSTGHSAR
ncbi:cellulase family glycosylhydrolase [Mycolicibacterium sp. ELW1]|uniref:cellulase family glycosylhydrolase n=1 Tax=Mycobacteriaceae TaxID=1762 RepID=UPI0011F01EFD|nr:cellulase family glycosylhydrolase [Mycobacterium sp. ELW1]QEN15840.1 glycoside hydrolase family 5 protein [Mycobacterium sp. ELW1]